ncbi:Tagatose-6-phosphate kinase [Paraliobacillus sp. PM-2]|uniref:hexose kinase n=1 Tax=Paraliobacillus sp. PM-2 TaxID=1462524 RepID=UPI00061BF956|nr:hexose kinase [Paraliobacillus sp. PM-2]CQR45939.1 Tagatose-6-phosphate kinase [Paraliobacillus sp. PM-2]
MILTITLNPSVDIRYSLDHFKLNEGNRVTNVSKTAGGKGLNVSRVLHQLGEEVAASGFLGGSLGGFIRNEVAKLNMKDFFTSVSGDTRNCIAIIHDGEQTEILEGGPVISSKEESDFLQAFSNYVKEVDIITMSGSLPKGLPVDFYSKLITIAKEHDKPVLLDTKGDLLKETLKSGIKPDLIKPNHIELGDLFGESFTDDASIMRALTKPSILDDVEWVVVTMGSQGAIVKHNNKLYRVNNPKVDAKNPVGSGDSVIAGFAAGLSQGLTDEALIKFGLSMGVLNVMEDQTGCIDTTNIDWCVNKMSIELLAD